MPPTAGEKALELAEAEVHNNPIGNERILHSSTGNPIVIRRSMNNDTPPQAPVPYGQENRRVNDVATVVPPPPSPDAETGGCHAEYRDAQSRPR